FGPDRRVAGPRIGPGIELGELDEADRGLDSGEAPVGADRIVEPAEQAGMDCGRVHLLPALAMVLIRPGPFPEIAVPEAGEAALAAGADDLVLAERKGRRVAEASGRPAFNRSALRLRAI